VLDTQLFFVMRWSEIPHLPDSNGNGGGVPSSSTSTPQIKNHSVTHHRGHLYCFGGYDGRRNHQTLLIYSLKEQRWISPSLSLGLLMDENGDGHENVAGSGFNNNHFDNSRNYDSSSNNNSNSLTQYYTVRGVPPPGRNGHTATLATTTRRRRRLRRQQQQLQLFHRDDAAVVDHHLLHPRSDDINTIVDSNTASGQEGDGHNRMSGGRRTLMGANAIDQSRETTQQQQQEHHQLHLHRHPWRTHPPSVMEGLGDLTIADSELAKREENGTDTISSEESDADAIESRKKKANGCGSDCSRDTAHDVVDEIHRHRMKQHGYEQEMEEEEEDVVVNDHTSNPNEVEASHLVALDEREYDTTNLINPMDDDDEDDDEDVNNNDNHYDAQIIIIGGWLGAGPYAASDMWVLDISGGLDRLRWFQPVRTHELDIIHYCFATLLIMP
jgi:hypothetical protein